MDKEATLVLLLVLLGGERKDTYSRTSLVKGFIVLDSKAMG